MLFVSVRILNIQLSGELAKLFPKLDENLHAVELNLECLTPIDDEKSCCLTPTSIYLDISTAATKGSTTISMEVSFIFSF